jgi:hypothetical protein
VDFT